MDLLQDIEYKADFIPLQKEKFIEDIKNQEKLEEQLKYERIEKEMMQEMLKKRSDVRIK